MTSDRLGSRSYAPTLPRRQAFADDGVGYRPGVDDYWSERVRQIEETLSLLRRAHPRNQPSDEDIVRLHEIHARHEREVGKEGNAVAAEERARRARARAARRGAGDGSA